MIRNLLCAAAVLAAGLASLSAQVKDADALGRVVIEVDIFREAERLPNSIVPSSLEDAQFSVPFTAALAALRGAAAFRPLRPEHLCDPEVLALAGGVEVRYPKEFCGVFPAETPARVTLRTANGIALKHVPRPLGDDRNPLSSADVRDKLSDLAAGLLSAEKSQAIADTVHDLVSHDASDLNRLLLPG